MWLTLFQLCAFAVAGYGDADDGLPSYSERMLHFWTNAVRVDPEAFKEDYLEGGCRWGQFSDDEQTAKPPLMWHHGLNEIARIHTEDMDTHDELRHESADGTSFYDRTVVYYDGGYLGENVAWGYGDERSAVLNGWMCSTTGHRENLMSGHFNELGTGVVGVYYTQDFGGRNITHRLISMGVHEPESPRSSVRFSADFYDSLGRSPDSFDVLYDGRLYPLELEFGTEAQGVWTTEVAIESEGCHTYLFIAEVDGERQTFPESGSYGFGPCEYDNASSNWIDRQDEVQGCGCSSPGTSGLLWISPLLLLLTRRRRLGEVALR